MILLLAAPYLFFLTIIVLSQLSYTQAMEMTLGSIGYPYAAMLLLIFLPNMIYAFILPRRGYTPQQLLFWDMLLKLCYIPLYILVFIAGMLLAGTIIGLGLIPFFMLFDYLLLLPSTMYGVSGLRQAYKAGLLSKGAQVGNSILHFFFCLDVLSAVIVFITVKVKTVCRRTQPRFAGW